MSTTIFKKVDWTLEALLASIRQGAIGLPDIQRPFVWKNVKVRDLLDSMYRGYPIGYLLLWESGGVETHKAIGVGEKQVAPGLVIVDGQQRLTSLYAVFNGVEVVRDNFSQERIHIAFNPLEERFEVATAATRQDRAFIPDVSVVWSGALGPFQLFNHYVERLRETRDVSEDDATVIEASLIRLGALKGFPLTALHLSADISEEDVAEVFVRVNSQGKSLNQADFILTLMSVFWDDGRTALEQFSRDARVPSAGAPSPFNHFIKPSPDQLLRVSVGLAFRRARLRSIYSVLRGKDLETDKFGMDRREQQFDRLKHAQQRVLNLDHWHGFMQCLRLAGFRTVRMINSQTALLYCYALYLIGRTELDVAEQELRRTIARWFFMASLTGRYTRAAESAMESDLTMLSGVSTPQEFVAKLSQAADIALTNDFWEVTLPNDLATSTARSPSLSAYEAALVLLDARVLFSETKVSDWLDPAAKPPKSIERHHLFPKRHLAKLGVTSRRDINQIANYAYVEWQDNETISTQAPSEYLPMMAQDFVVDDLERMYRLHALPYGWEQMPYDKFLMERRVLMAQIIREAYGQLSQGPTASEPTGLDLTAIIASGEADRVEFKSTLRVNLHTHERDTRMESTVIKTIAGFLNTHGGTLIIGVADDGNPVGIDADGFANEDKMSQHLANLVNDRIGAKAWASIHANFDDYNGVRVLSVRCEAAQSASYVKEGKIGAFYIRAGTSTVALPVDQIAEYVKQRFG